jgi:hypothetical protein
VAWKSPYSENAADFIAAVASISGSDRMAQVILLMKGPRVAADDAGKKTMPPEEQDRCRTAVRLGGYVRKCCVT